MTLWLRIGVLVRLPLYDLFLINLIGLFFCTRLKFSIIKNIPLIRYYKPDFNILAHSTWFSIILEFLVRSCTDRGILISYFVGTIFTLFFFLSMHLRFYDTCAACLLCGAEGSRTFAESSFAKLYLEQTV